MLSQRQIEILLELCEKQNQNMTASYFANKLRVSLRTVQSDIKIIRKEIETSKCIQMITNISKGTHVIIKDKDAYSVFKDSLYKRHANVSISYQSGRVNKILYFLLKQRKATSLSTIESQIYVSHSTMLGDLKKTIETLKKYNLELLKNGKKFLIDGSEINKRLLIADIPSENLFSSIEEKRITQIKDILFEILKKYKYFLSDIEAKKAIILLNTIISRIQDEFYINKFELKISESLENEIKIVRELFHRFKMRFLIKAIEEEIDYFALYLKGQGNLQDMHMVSNEIDDFIVSALLEIKDILGIDFTDNIDLQVSLSLHCTPLIIRIKHNIQIKNNLLAHIKQTLPQGYNIGVYFAYLLQKKYYIKVLEDEIAFLAIYFYIALRDINSDNGKKRIAVITSLKRSSAIFLRQTLLTWFASDISLLDFVSPNEITSSILDYYDVILTTYEGEYFERNVAMLINSLPDKQDYFNIKLAIAGFKNINDFISIFSEALFCHIENKNKEAILQELCQKSEQKFNLESLYHEVLLREEIRSTYFSKGIAVPHPMHAISSATFIAVGVSKKTIIWDEEGNEVNLVLLVCIGQNNPQAFQLWNYLSKMFMDNQFLRNIIQNPVYENFIDTIHRSFNQWIESSGSL